MSALRVRGPAPPLQGLCNSVPRPRFRPRHDPGPGGLPRRGQGASRGRRRLQEDPGPGEDLQEVRSKESRQNLQRPFKILFHSEACRPLTFEVSSPPGPPQGSPVLREHVAGLFGCFAVFFLFVSIVAEFQEVEHENAVRLPRWPAGFRVTVL